ncbi:MAG: hypothetical protein K8T25_05310 [Planctomycetia bacterium]|nr:hypothetical protein [Planctomycetia bacterium]
MSRFQFRLRTLLLFVTLAAALCGAALWWITLPVQTWHQFVARVQAGDIDGANALCEADALRVMKDGALHNQNHANSFPTLVENTAMGEIAHAASVEPRSWIQLVTGDLRAGTPEILQSPYEWRTSHYFAKFEVRRGKIVFAFVRDLPER